jgi:hypothetical protein
MIWAGPPASNPGNPFSEIFAQIGILNDKLDDLLAHGNGMDLRGVTQNWDKKLDATNGDANGCNSDRFTCIFGDTAVRDNETGLVWERTLVGTGPRNWYAAIEYCANKRVGGRLGWHLPMREQLASLVDTPVTMFAVTLPDGHPFLGVLTARYWSATTVADDPSKAWDVFFFPGPPVPFNDKVSAASHAWCVRGGQAFDGNTHTTPPS